VEHAPQHEIATEIFVVMLAASRDEQQVARFKRASLAIVDENAAAADDDMELVCVEATSAIIAMVGGSG
jgi:hypothetical protein